MSQKQKAGLVANLSIGLLPIAAMIAGTLAVPELHHARLEDFFIGGFVGAVTGLCVAPFARLAHRWGVEWIGALIAALPWLVYSLVGDFGWHRSGFESDVVFQRAVLADALEDGPFLTTITAPLLATLALVPSRRCTGRAEDERSRCARRWLNIRSRARLTLDSDGGMNRSWPRPASRSIRTISPGSASRHACITRATCPRRSPRGRSSCDNTRTCAGCSTTWEHPS